MKSPVPAKPSTNNVNDPSITSPAWANQAVRWGILVLLALMPFHAFLSVWAGSIATQPSIIQAWKELLIVFMAIPAVLLLYRQPSLAKKPLVVAIIFFAAIAILTSLVYQPSWTLFLLGAKTDLLFLVVFVMAYLIGNKSFRQTATKVLITSSGIVIAVGLLQVFILPKDFLANFGYSELTVVPYQLVAGAEESVRILSTLGGPNQLGTFLILPMCLVLAMLLKKPRWWHPAFLIGGLIIEWNTYSRSAWMGISIAALFTIIFSLPQRWRLKVALITASIGLGIIGLIALNFNNPQVQHYILHGSTTDLKDSTDLHASALQSGFEYTIQNPLGSGLGSAGPASFHGDKPFIPESYYLQISAEVGVIGLLLFICICVLLARELWPYKKSASAISTLAALIGVSVVNLFLHGWADSSTALTYWAYAGIVVGSKV